MPSKKRPQVRDFADRALRDELRNPENVRDFVREALPDLVDRLDFSKMSIVDREFLLPDYEVRESDLLMRVPLRKGHEGEDIVLAILIEHQSTIDLEMPLRMLIYTVLYWMREWRQWEKSAKRSARRLTPIVPIVFYTGKRP